MGTRLDRALLNAVRRFARSVHMVVSRAVVLVLGLGIGVAGCLEVHSGHRAETAVADTSAGGDTQIGGDTHATEAGPEETADSGPTGPDAPDVGVCTAASCDDGDPCTDDGCILEQCEHQAVEGCDPECSSNGLSWIGSARYAGPEGTFIKTSGTAQMARNGLCLDVGMCECYAGPALVDGDYEMGLLAGQPGAGGPADPALGYACQSTDDVAAPNHVRVDCQPFQAGVGYRAWGTGAYVEAPYTAGGLVPLRPFASVAVQGYCLDTGTDEVLRGDYAVRVTFDDGPDVAAHARIWGVDQGELLDLRADDPNDDVIGVTGGVVERLDNGIRFLFATREGAPYGVDEVIARLVARENRLEGRFVSSWSARGPLWGYTGISNAIRAATGTDSDGVFRPVTSGTIVLVRLPPAEGVRNPCSWMP